MSLILEVPDDLANSLAGIAATQQITVQQLALDRLRELVPSGTELRPGSPAAILRAMREHPILSSADVAELDAAIVAGRLPVRTKELF